MAAASSSVPVQAVQTVVDRQTAAAPAEEAAAAVEVAAAAAAAVVVAAAAGPAASHEAIVGSATEDHPGLAYSTSMSNTSINASGGCERTYPSHRYHALHPRAHIGWETTGIRTILHAHHHGVWHRTLTWLHRVLLHRLTGLHARRALGHSLRLHPRWTLHSRRRSLRHGHLS